MANLYPLQPRRGQRCKNKIVFGVKKSRTKKFVMIICKGDKSKSTASKIKREIHDDFLTR